MSPHVRAAALFCLLLLSSAVLAKDKPTPTPAPDDKGQAGEPAKPKDGEPTSKPAKPKDGEPTSKPASPKGEHDLLPIELNSEDDDVKGLPSGLQVPRFDMKNKVFEYLKPSPDQQKLWVQFHKAQSDDALKKLSSLNCALVETDHYLIYTNWPADQYPFLKTNLEGLFSTFVELFKIDKSDNAKLFLGKMPVYCVETQEQFARLSRSAFHNPVSEGVLGYCQSNSWGLVKLVLYRTEGYRGKSQLVRWGEVMSHEGTHAFVARYISNRRIPAWMNEGLAEYVSCEIMRKFQGRNVTEKSEKIRESINGAQRVARDSRPLRSPLFEFPGSPAADFYPVAWSITKMLIKQNPKAYVQMIRDIKEGTVTGTGSANLLDDPSIGEKALEKNFGCDYDKLEATWRKWILNPANTKVLEN